MTYDKPLSFSQANMFNTCPKSWYFKYIKKVPIVQELHYAHRGSVVHNCLELYYKNKDRPELQAIKDFFNEQWLKYKLDKTILANKKDESWLMVVNGINLNLKVTDVELKIFFPDVLGYLDVVNREDHILEDWKTSTRSAENEEEYTRQLLLYAYLYARYYGTLPKKCIVRYLKYNGSKGILEVVPTMEDVEAVEKMLIKAKKDIEYYIKFPEMLPDFNKEFFWSPYKQYWDKEDSQVHFVITIKGATVKLAGPITDLINKKLEKKFSYELKDAFFMRQKNPHAITTIKFWNKHFKTLPIGFLPGLKKTLNDYIEWKGVKGDIRIVDERNINETKVTMPEKLIGCTLRDYQEDAVNTFIEDKIGLLELGTGAGKTVIAGEIIRKFGCTTIFIVDKKELLTQTRKRLSELLGKKVGQLGGGQSSIGSVTVATIQTLIRNYAKPNFKKYLETVRLAIFDECHHASSMSYMKISKKLPNAEFRLGITGTAFRDDGNDMAINSVVGDKIFELNSKKLIAKGWLVKPTIKFIRVPLNKVEFDDIYTEYKPVEEDAANIVEFTQFYKGFISENKKRNDMIIELTKHYKNKKILVLVKLVEHGKMLEKLIPGSNYIHGSLGVQKRSKIFEEFKASNNGILIGTLSIFSEGIDIPSLDLIINASANKGDVKTIQVLGRVLRLLDGKENAFYIDFVDSHKLFTEASKSRVNVLRSQGHDVDIVDLEDVKNDKN